MLIYLQEIADPQNQYRFEQLYLGYRQLMFHIANNILRNEYDAEDAVHQAFLAVAKNMDKISDLKCTKTKAYLVTIAEHCAIDLYRARKRRATVPLNEELAGLEFDPPHTSALADVIARLPARYRHMILLKYDCGYSYNEIAELLGLSYEGVHSLDQRAKRKLKKLLEETGIET